MHCVQEIVQEMGAPCTGDRCTVPGGTCIDQLTSMS